MHDIDAFEEHIQVCESAAIAPAGLRAVTWNIERGYRLGAVIEELKEEKADVLMLQEVDVGCARSYLNDTGAEIAKALGMQVVFVPEKGAISSGSGPSRQAGHEGVAILTPHTILDFRALPLPSTTPDNPPPNKRRTALRVEIDSPIGPVVCYCLHLDAFAGRSSRVKQFRPVLDDALLTISKGKAVVIGGDFNTHNHGIARLSRRMSGPDGMTGLGKTEAQWWEDTVFRDTTLRDPFAKNDDSHNTWVSVGPVAVWGGKIDWLLYSTRTLTHLTHHVSRGGTASDHPYLRLDLFFQLRSLSGLPSGAVDPDAEAVATGQP